MKEPAIELRNVSKSYGPGEAQSAGARAVLRDLSLTLMPGEALAVVGPSGSGKSTLLNLIGGLDRPSAGQVLIGGRNLGAMSDDELAQVRNTAVGFVFQLHHLLPQLTVMQNILLPTLARRRHAPRAARERALALLESVGLGDRPDAVPGQLSGGERQRVAVVRALINSPPILLADEPTGSLDRRTAGELADLLGRLNRQQRVTLVVATHSETLARHVGNVAWFEDGSLRRQT